MIFLTIGTLFEFDRLVKAVDELLESGNYKEDFFAQIGPGIYKPRNMPYVDYLQKNEFDLKVQACEAMVSHAGIGSISTAINCKKPLMVMPRLKKYGEHVNDHQLHTALKFEELGHIVAAYDTNELVDKIRLLKTFDPKPRVPNRQGVIDRIGQFLRELER
jgi:UDP-N-acetylglucosamine transferase subunit ALG13